MLALLVPTFVCAADGGAAGAMELSALKGLLMGQAGLAIGLLLTVWGIWKAFVGGDTGTGLLIMVCGVLLTIFPNFFNMVASVVDPVVAAISGR